MGAQSPKSPSKVIDTPNGDQVVVNTDGTASVTSSGGVEFLLAPDSQPKVAGLTAFGIDDLAQVTRFETIINGRVTTHRILFQGGSTGEVSYIDGVFNAYSGVELGMDIRKYETKAYLKPGQLAPRS